MYGSDPQDHTKYHCVCHSGYARVVKDPKDQTKVECSPKQLVGGRFQDAHFEEHNLAVFLRRHIACKSFRIMYKNGATSGFEMSFAPSTFGAVGPNQNTSRIQHNEFNPFSVYFRISFFRQGKEATGPRRSGRMNARKAATTSNTPSIAARPRISFPSTVVIAPRRIRIKITTGMRCPFLVRAREHHFCAPLNEAWRNCVVDSTHGLLDRSVSDGDG